MEPCPFCQKPCHTGRDSKCYDCYDCLLKMHEPYEKRDNWDYITETIYLGHHIVFYLTNIGNKYFHIVNTQEKLV